ncbi:MAG: hypothetical protein JW817_06435 [Clostridiales bacterium]|nr:hypothetical protein [Clostridiales bacterium]
MRRQLRAFERLGDNLPFWKVKPEDYGKDKKYYVYEQADHWRVYGKDEVAPKRRIRNEANPFLEMNEEYVQEMLSTLGYETKEEWWEKEERYNCLLSSDQMLREKDIPRPEGKPGYALPTERQDHQLTHGEFLEKLPSIMEIYYAEQEITEKKDPKRP